MTTIELLLAVPRERAAEYYNGLSSSGRFQLTLYADTNDALAALEDHSRHFDAFVVDSRLEGFEMLAEEARFLRPHLLTVIVAPDGQPVPEAGYVCSTPFIDDELSRQLIFLLSDRQLETVSIGVGMPVRQLARRLRAVNDRIQRCQITVDTCCSLGYVYSAFYQLDAPQAGRLTRIAQSGPPALVELAPATIVAPHPIAETAKQGKSRVLGPEASEMVAVLGEGRLGALACVPCSLGVQFGVLVAGRTAADTIKPQHLATLELIAAQLAASLARELGG
ncbi:MAG: hypothetical protein DIU68_005360 [Chloroflexota bacterium]|nr:MAG: hypothetical protein DIU68_09975 [Chloroflexota bacterium]